MINNIKKRIKNKYTIKTTAILQKNYYKGFSYIEKTIEIVNKNNNKRCFFTIYELSYNATEEMFSIKHMKDEWVFPFLLRLIKRSYFAVYGNFFFIPNEDIGMKDYIDLFYGDHQKDALRIQKRMKKVWMKKTQGVVSALDALLLPYCYPI